MHRASPPRCGLRMIRCSKNLPEKGGGCELKRNIRDDVRRGRSVLPRGHEEADDGFLAERLGCFKSVQALDQHKARAVRPHQDRRLLAAIEHAGRDLVHALLFERGASFDRHVDVGIAKVSRFIIADGKG